jgi:hypothetical protein
MKAANKNWMWDHWNYEPVVGGLTALETLSKRLSDGSTINTLFDYGYIHEITADNKVIILVPELWIGTGKTAHKIQGNEWVILDYDKCNPITKYGFDRLVFEAERPNLPYSKTKNTIERPFKTYNGGKSGNGTYQQIINHIPKCDVFVDAMVGNGGIVSNLLLPGLTVINDIDISVIDKYDVAVLGKKIIKENLCYRSLIDKYADRIRKVFFYFDPPYLKSSRKSDKNLYKFEWTDKQHEDFLSMAVTVTNNCMISHYPCELYDNFLRDWQKHDFVSMTRSGLRTERIYMNYDMPVILQDFRYVGDNFRERQRIKRKINRFISKLDGLPPAEKTAILSAVIVNYSDASAKLI